MEEDNLLYKSIKDSTPMMSQYLSAKAECPDSLLLFRLGDFYELFFDDAKKASSILNLVLTHRGKVGGDEIPMCGIPVATLDNYVGKLIKSGQKVAICEQMEDPQEAKKRGYKAIVKREITRVISAGTLIEDNLLTYNQHNYLMSLVPVFKRDVINHVSFALIDISTGDFFVNTVSYKEIFSVLETHNPKEILIPSGFEEFTANIEKISSATLTVLPRSKFNPIIEQKRLEKYFQVNTLESFGLTKDTELSCCGSILEYLMITQKNNLTTLPIPKKIFMKQYLVIDAATAKSLEIMSSSQGQDSGSLLHAIDNTKTAFGARLLVARLAMPIIDINLLTKRLDCVEFFRKNQKLSEDIRKLLSECPDLERAINRVRFNKFSPKDMEAIRDSIRVILKLQKLCSNSEILTESEEFSFYNLADFNSLHVLLSQALVEKFSTNGFLIAEKYSEELDKLRYLRSHVEDLMQKLQDKYIYKTGINTLKIRNNAIIGWYIEIPASQKNKVLAEFVHRQTLVNNIRYTSDEILELQSQIVSAAEKCNNLEQQLYAEIVNKVTEKYNDISYAVKVLSLLDIYTNFAVISLERNYIRPEITDKPILEIEDGRHPVLEHNQENFIANTCNLSEESRICLLTGPNMAGKSTYLRQNALLIILAQMGSYIPASKAKIGIVDRLFSRIGASDDIVRGRSTFMVEMIETATILNQATEKSFVILDEVGRGTSTYDGLSIAWAVIENLYNINKCRVLFATHYRELTALKDSLPQINCKTLKVQEWQGNVVFYHKIIDGIADKSYGIHVASIAGVPPSVIRRAKELLAKFETQKSNFDLTIEPADQMELSYSSSKIEEKLKQIDLNNLTPLQALNFLQDLKNIL